jgi:hypothetical protein
MLPLSQAWPLGGLHRAAPVPFRGSSFTSGLHPPEATPQRLIASLYRRWDFPSIPSLRFVAHAIGRLLSRRIILLNVKHRVLSCSLLVRCDADLCPLGQLVEVFLPLLSATLLTPLPRPKTSASRLLLHHRHLPCLHATRARNEGSSAAVSQKSWSVCTSRRNSTRSMGFTR